MWSTLDVNGKPVDLFEPPGERPRSALFWLHDTDGKHPATFPLACICPHGGQSWWSSRIFADFKQQSAEQWLLHDVVPTIAARWELAPNALAISGVGMGGQGALRLALKHPARFPIVAAVNAALDHHELYGEGTPLDEMYASREHCRQDTAILHIHPAKQPAHIWFGVDPASRWFRGNDRLHEKFGALGVAHTFEVRKAIAANLEEMFRFIMEALTVEGRRLL